jgi:hypothetical protein
MSKRPLETQRLATLRWVAGPAVLAGLLVWIVGFSHGDANARVHSPKDGDDQAPATAATSSLLGAAPTRLLSKAAREEAAREVARVVARKNEEAQKDRRAFEKDGWEIVQAPPPDRDVVELSPKLLDGREGELRVQMASTVARPADSDNLADIARRARAPETRTAAVEALGRVGGPEAQRALFGLLHNGELQDGDSARKAIAPLLRPAELADPYAAQLAAELDSRGINAVERKQIAFTLALIGLRDGTELPDAVLQSLSPSSRELLAQMTALASAKNPLH